MLYFQPRHPFCPICNLLLLSVGSFIGKCKNFIVVIYIALNTNCEMMLNAEGDVETLAPYFHLDIYEI